MNKTNEKDLIRERLVGAIDFSAKSLGEIAKEVGCTKSILSQYKTGNKLPSLAMFARICAVIGADANQILGINEHI